MCNDNVVEFFAFLGIVLRCCIFLYVVIKLTVLTSTIQRTVVDVRIADRRAQHAQDDILELTHKLALIENKLKFKELKKK